MNGQALRIWLVDDDASIRWVLERALRNGGMSPRAFEAAEPALQVFPEDTGVALPARIGQIRAECMGSEHGQVRCRVAGKESEMADLRLAFHSSLSCGSC